MVWFVCYLVGTLWCFNIYFFTIICRIRHGYVHVVNNDYTKWGMYAIGGSASPTILSQGNRFLAPDDEKSKEVKSPYLLFNFYFFRKVNVSFLTWVSHFYYVLPITIYHILESSWSKIIAVIIFTKIYPIANLCRWPNTKMHQKVNGIIGIGNLKEINF